MRVISMLRDQFDIELPLLTFFDNPTVAKLAGAVLATAVIGAMARDSDQQAQIAQLLESVEQLSVEEAQQRIDGSK